MVAGTCTCRREREKKGGNSLRTKNVFALPRSVILFIYLYVTLSDDSSLMLSGALLASLCPNWGFRYRRAAAGGAAGHEVGADVSCMDLGLTRP